jgi:serine/threonine protein kinase
VSSALPNLDDVEPHSVGRYTLLHELASGGMGTVHLARFQGEVGFSRTVVVKRMHPQFAKEPEFVCMFLDEARLASRIRHPNVVSVLDVANSSGALLLVMEYVHGLSLSQVMTLVGADGLPPEIAAAIACGLLFGLHAAHEAKTDRGQPLELVHRDVSPQNVMLGADGVARVVDFGIASATARLTTTAQGQLKGKLSYMAPEQVRGEPLDRRADVFAAGIVLWEMLTARRLVFGSPEARLNFILNGEVAAPSTFRPGLPAAIDEVVMRALARDRQQRFATTEQMAAAVMKAITPAHAFEVARWLESIAAPVLNERAAVLEAAERRSVRPLSPSAPDAFEAAHSITRVQLPSFDDYTAPRASSDSVSSPTTVVSPQAVRRPSRKGTALLLGAALALPLMLAARAALYRQPGADVQANAKSAPPAEPASKLAEMPKPVVVVPAPPAIDSAAAALPPAPKAAAPSRSVTSKRRTAPTKTTPAPTPTPTVSKMTNDPCSPPYVLLKGGLKRYKAECL